MLVTSWEGFQEKVGEGLVMYSLEHGEGVGRRGRKTGEKTRKQGLLGEEANGRRWKARVSFKEHIHF